MRDAAWVARMEARCATIDRVVALPCFVRRGVGLLDPLHKLLLLQLALLSEDGSRVEFDHDSAARLRQQTSLTPIRLAGALRRLDSGHFAEVAGDVECDKFTVYILKDFD